MQRMRKQYDGHLKAVATRESFDSRRGVGAADVARRASRVGERASSAVSIEASIGALAMARAMGRRRGTTTKDDGAIGTRDSRRGIRDGGTRGDAATRARRRRKAMRCERRRGDANARRGDDATRREGGIGRFGTEASAGRDRDRASEGADED